VNSVQDLLAIINFGIDSARPSTILPTLFQEVKIRELESWLRSSGRVLLCIGKASLNAVETILTRIQVSDHLVIAPASEGHSLPYNIHLGSHPIPDERSLGTAQKLLDWLHSLNRNSNLLIVLSGGSSALMVSPIVGLSLQSKIQVNELLLASGASIQEINTVRKHLSNIKGGRLAKEIQDFRDPVVLVISDVIGDDLSSIGSGPFFEDPTTFAQAQEVLQRYGIWEKLPEDVVKVVSEGLAGRLPETPKPGQISIPHYIIASNELAKAAAAKKAKELGYSSELELHPVSGLVEDFVPVALQLLRTGNKKNVIILGGELTVRLKGKGRGGRNQHLALTLTRPLIGTNVVFAAAGTDGIDGNSPAAGAWTDGKTAQKAIEKGLSIEEYLRNFDSFNFFNQLGQNIMTGPTGTNVMDLYIGLTSS
jgi:glycerate 2-kinase